MSEPRDAKYYAKHRGRIIASSRRYYKVSRQAVNARARAKYNAKNPRGPYNQRCGQFFNADRLVWFTVPLGMKAAKRVKSEQKAMGARLKRYQKRLRRANLKRGLWDFNVRLEEIKQHRRNDVRIIRKDDMSVAYCCCGMTSEVEANLAHLLLNGKGRKHYIANGKRELFIRKFIVDLAAERLARTERVRLFSAGFAAREAAEKKRLLATKLSQSIKAVSGRKISTKQLPDEMIALYGALCDIKNFFAETNRKSSTTKENEDAEEFA